MQSLVQSVRDVRAVNVYGQVRAVRGMRFDVEGLGRAVPIGGRVQLQHTVPLSHASEPLVGEVVGFDGDVAVCLPFGSLDGVRTGSRVLALQDAAEVRPSAAWLGRVVNGMGEAADGKGALPRGDHNYALNAAPPAAHACTPHARFINFQALYLI